MYLPDVAQIDGVTSSAPVWRDPSAQLGDALLPLVAVPTDRLDSLVHLPDSARLPDVAALRTDDAGGVPIPDGAARLTVSMDLSVGLDPWQELALGQVPETSRQNSIANGDTDEQSIAAQIDAESGWNPRAVSPAGAQGLSQFMPGTWAAYGRDDDGNGRVSPYDAGDAIMAQARYDCEIAASLRGVVAGDLLDLTLAGYNAGPGAVMLHGGVPPYAETRAYVAKIRGLASGKYAKAAS